MSGGRVGIYVYGATDISRRGSGLWQSEVKFGLKAPATLSTQDTSWTTL